MSKDEATPVTGALLGWFGTLLGTAGCVAVWIPGLAPGGMLLGVGALVAGVAALMKKAPRKVAVAALVVGALATGSGTVNSDWESVPAAITTVDGREGVGTSRSEAVAIGSKIASEGWTVVVNSVDTVARDAWGDRPDDFSDLLTVNLTATRGDEGDVGEPEESPLVTVAYESVGGTTVASGDWIAQQPFPEHDAVAPGGSVTGDLLFEIPEMPWRDGYVTVSPSLGGAHVYVRLE